MHIIGLNVAPEQEGVLQGVPFLHGKFHGLIDYIGRYDAFQDVPFSIKSTYAQVDALFPESKFILTHRDPEVWFNSVLNYAKKTMKVSKNRAITRENMASVPYLYPGFREFNAEANYLAEVDDTLKLSRNWSLLYDKDRYIEIYTQRNKAVVRHFSERPDDLLVIDITREKNTQKIVDFLCLPKKLVTAVPHLNKT